METLTPHGRWLEALPDLSPVDLVIEAGAAPAAADDPGLLALQDDVVRAFPEYRLATYFAERPSAVADAHHVVVARNPADGRLRGLVVARHRRGAAGSYLHVEMNLITAERQRRGALLPLWRAMLARLTAGPAGFPPLVAIKTYNPMVYSSLLVVARLTGAALYPSLPATGPAGLAAGLADVAALVAAELAPSCPFDPATGALQGAGTPRDFYAAMPTTNKRQVQAYFARHLQPGDRLLCLVRFGPEAELARLMRRWSVATHAPTEGSSHA
jgi:hypothetical protein